MALLTPFFVKVLRRTKRAFNQIINYWEKEKENLATVRKWMSYSRLVKYFSLLLGLTSAILAVLNRNQNEKISSAATSFAVINGAIIITNEFTKEFVLEPIKNRLEFINLVNNLGSRLRSI
ncbi:2754_t:CDS:1 [Scutellospora calospora]|uniref:2754_t:CDS:1 n=1 Tax=Scutellospora calospora TaxID=85575 RepID=A0ACA9L157_9GLOM|nr:2754_t:CDS:1 [Scutellospora calospora]